MKTIRIIIIDLLALITIAGIICWLIGAFNYDLLDYIRNGLCFYGFGATCFGVGSFIMLLIYKFVQKKWIKLLNRIGEYYGI